MRVRVCRLGLISRTVSVRLLGIRNRLSALRIGPGPPVGFIGFRRLRCRGLGV